jgi:AcrR family transcriptional regulator
LVDIFPKTFGLFKKMILTLIEHSVIYKMPRTREQFNEIREARKRLIMRTALDLFAKEGYGHVSIASLARQAGMSKGLMYNYFESKEQLLKAILDGGINEIVHYFDPDHDGVLTENEFILFIRKTFHLLKTDKDFWLKFLRLIIQPNVTPLLQHSSIVPFINTYLGMFEAYFKKQGFEDPMLEVLNLSVLLEGFGMIMVFYEGITGIPEDLFEKFEKRIIDNYTTKQ